MIDRGSKENLISTSCSPKTVPALEVRHAYPQLTPVAHEADIDNLTLFYGVPDKVKAITTKSRFFIRMIEL